MLQITVSPGTWQIIFLLFILIPLVLFLLNQYNLLKAIRPENRLMQPGLVWLQIIPYFGFIWQFVVVTRIAGSIKKELEAEEENSVLGMSEHAAETWGQRPTLAMGLSFCILGTISVCINYSHPARPLALISSLIMLAAFVCMVIYWVQLSSYKKRFYS